MRHWKIFLKFNDNHWKWIKLIALITCFAFSYEKVFASKVFSTTRQKIKIEASIQESSNNYTQKLTDRRVPYMAKVPDALRIMWERFHLVLSFFFIRCCVLTTGSYILLKTLSYYGHLTNDFCDHQHETTPLIAYVKEISCKAFKCLRNYTSNREEKTN